MNVDFTARQLRLDPAVRELATRKLESLGRVLPPDAQARVIVRREKKEVVVEVTIQGRHRTWTGTAIGAEQEPVAREALERIEAQARKNRAKVKEVAKHRATTVRSPETWGEEAAAPVAPPRPEARPPKVEKVTPRPTFEEDAIHKFLKWDRQIFVYSDPSDESLRILYRRRDGSLRILVPQA